LSIVLSAIQAYTDYYLLQLVYQQQTGLCTAAAAVLIMNSIAPLSDAYVEHLSVAPAASIWFEIWGIVAADPGKKIDFS